MSAPDDSATVSNDAFLAAMPGFANTILYPPMMIAMYLKLANKRLNYQRWGETMPLGSMLWAAHFLTLDAQDIVAASSGKLVGAPSNPMASKSLGGASISYDTSSGTEVNAGHWNSTGFGRRFIRFCRMAGMGGIQINGGGNIIGMTNLFVLGLQQGE